MKKRSFSFILILSLLAATGSDFVAQESDANSDDKNVSFALSKAAVQLDWVGKVETANLPSDAKMFMIRDSKGLLAITRYPDKGTAEKAFASSSGGATENTFQGFPAHRRSSGGALTWLSESFVFSVGSRSGEAEKIGDALAKAAVESALVPNPEKSAPNPGIGSKPMTKSGDTGSESIPAAKPVAPPGPEPGLFIANGDFESGIAMDPGSGSLMKDPTDPTNQVLALSPDDYFEQHLAVPDEVDSLLVSFRVLVPASVTIDSFEPGKPAPGVKLRMRTIDPDGNSRLSEWVLQPGNEWQEFSLRATGIGQCREKVSLEASWFTGTIYIDDMKSTSLFPEFLSDGLYEHYKTPAQVTYFYVVNPLFSSDRVTRVGSPKITEKKVTIDFVFDGGRDDLWFVEKSNDGETAAVVVGPPNSGGDLYRLKKIEGRWAISGIEESDGL